jgi:AhpD family alkylhydroperoxidase
MDNLTKALVSIGASVAANCQPCLTWYISKAREAGVDEKDIAMAIEVAKAVRAGAANNMDTFALTAIGKSADNQPPTGCKCGC